MTTEPDEFDLIVIGGGVVGVAVLRAATLAGYRCALVEADRDLLSAASGGNSGIACTGVDAEPGTLERALIRDSIAQMRPFLKKHNIPFRPCGSLVCQWEWDRQQNASAGLQPNYYSSLGKVLAESLDAGDTNARRLTPEEVGQLEPNVSALCHGAVHIPGEIVLDPWLFSIALVAHARENGAKIFTNFEFCPDSSSWNKQTKQWTVCRTTDRDHLLDSKPPTSFRAKAIVNACGIMADIVQSETKGVKQPVWKAAPRRGQYRVFSSDNVTGVTRPIQPVPTPRTKGIFIYSTLYDQIVVGPTAEDQQSRFDRSINAAVTDQLTQFATKVLPDLEPEQQHVGEYVGIRPGSNRRDYQIHMTPERCWIAVAGIRSTGLTASLGIGRHVVNLFDSVLDRPEPLANVRTTPLPPIDHLVEDFNTNSEGLVMIHGYLYKVSHPLTRFGWEARTGIASVKAA